MLVPYRFVSLTQTIPPAVEPVTLADAKLWLKVDQDSDDALITELITTARIEAEKLSGRAFISQQFQLSLTRLPDSGLPIVLYRAPVISVDSVEYCAPDNPFDFQTMVQGTDAGNPGDYLPVLGTPGRISRVNGWWPLTYIYRLDAVHINYTCGYGPDATSVPTTAKTLIKCLTQLYYDNRSSMTTLRLSEIPLHLQRLADSLSYGTYPD